MCSETAAPPIRQVSRVRPGYEHTIDYKFYIDRARVLASTHRVFMNLYLEDCSSDLVKVCSLQYRSGQGVQSIA